MRILSFLLLSACCGLLSCSSSDAPEAGEEVFGFDEDVDPDALEDYMGKADGNPCAGHPGGTLAGDDLLVIVNKDEARQLRSDWRPSDLVVFGDGDMMPGRTGEARMAVLVAWRKLAEAAKGEAGLDLGIRSAFRSFETQCYTFNYKVQESGYEHASKFSARPGRSEHQLGTAIDITSSSLGWALTQTMGDRPEGAWLAANAHRFGFALSYPRGWEEQTGYGYEPWHWRYIGVDAAAEMHEAGLTLIEYLLACESGDAALACPREAPPVVEPNEGFVGGVCEDAEECTALDDTRQCLTDGYPGGHCTIACTLYCPDRAGANSGTFCVADGEDASTGTCHSRCDESLFPGTGCREGYVCEERSRPNDAGTGQVCVPAP